MEGDRSGILSFLSPAVTTATGFLWAGLLLGVHTGLVALGIAPPIRAAGWSHIHLVTIGGLVILVLGTAPGFLAWKQHRSAPPARSGSIVPVLLAVGILSVWTGRAIGLQSLYDVGLVLIWITVGSMVVVVGRSLWAADSTHRDSRRWLIFVSVLSLWFGTTLAAGLYGHPVSLPGGWAGLREAHIHANALGFAGLAIVATFLEAMSPLVENGPSRRVRRWITMLLLGGIGPLVVGPLLGLDRTVTVVGMVLFGAGYLLYLRSVVRTYRASCRSGPALWVLLAHGWILAPTVLVPVTLSGFIGVDLPAVEASVLHGLFLGWILPISLTALLMITRLRDNPAVRLRKVIEQDGPVTRGFALVWHGAVLSLGFGIAADGNVGRVAFVVGLLTVTVQWGLVLLHVRLVPSRRPGMHQAVLDLSGFR